VADLGGDVSDRTFKWLIVLGVIAIVIILVIVISGVFSNTCPCNI
jgi:hypothetical protein